MIRGAVYRVDLGAARGHEQGGRRYGVVLAPATGVAWSVVVVVPTSTRAQPARFRPQLELAGQPTVLLVDQLRAVDVDHVHGDPVDHLGPDELAELEHTVSRYLGLD
ncbi:type II toxin-antitoxin system PemK/MazF family toxin [Cellulomonas fimi]|uniref:type II toxin-antitoxin system PemK/MazF family toxin n=1 Tax=Cellulomonas fimi TaxID=1708 RepID=UPI00234CE4AE|nr:type II toxin-antitoxin system PemK/MazF family toxin [Cellulomonas fimi]